MLKHLSEFQAALANYHISETSKQILENTKLVLLVAPSSSGRNTLIRELLKTGQYHYIVSDTTRNPRVNDGVLEQNGVEYWFRTEKDILTDLQKGKFLEAAIIHNQQVSGISIRELEQAKHEGRAAITDIEVVGVQNIMEAKPDAIAVFVLPPGFEEWMKRLAGRGHLPTDEKRRRLESAVKEFSAALEHDYYHFIVNDTLEGALQQIQTIVQEGSDRSFNEKGRKLAEELREETQEWLNQN